VAASIWRITVGRVPLYLLSTNLARNHPDDRLITAHLYGGDREMRIRQEIVLGIGGSLALKALGLQPTVLHMNEGHSAFLPFERMRELMAEAGLSYQAAFEASYPGSVFTTHTPVPAGNDVFEKEQLKRYLLPLAGALGLDWEDFAAFGRDHDAGGGPGSFCMTVAALRCAAFSNGVSRLHAGTSRRMWQSLWPELPVEEVPITPVTNGIHLYSWLSHEMGALLDRQLDPLWRDDPIAPGIWNRIFDIPDEELWAVRQQRRKRLVEYTRHRLVRQLQSRGAAPDEIKRAQGVLDPDALTIGFARRFATYKRATLLLRDIERLRRLCGDQQRPLQFIFAGKAHPRDEDGKRFIRELIHALNSDPLRGRMVFLEDYGMSIARYMVQGCDVWLNTPRRPLEASGTSGMKSVANGGLHLSTLDGWWDQSYEASYGWAIGNGEEYDDAALQDQIEGDALYELLENQVVPQFYAREHAGLPHEWIGRIKRSMSSLIPRFTSHRMLRNYIEEAYVPAHEAQAQLSADNYRGARELADWRQRVEQHWAQVAVQRIEVSGESLNGAQVLPGRSSGSGSLNVGEALQVRALVAAGGLSPDELLVEVYAGTVDANGGFRQASSQAMHLDETDAQGRLVYSAALASQQSGQFGFTVRVLPRHPQLQGKFASHLLTWADAPA
jgi:starch phosphorylase